MSTVSRMDSAIGIFLGAAVGDALGWPQENRSSIVGGQKARDAAESRLEFRAWQRTGGYTGHRYRDHVAAGAYSDDTQLLLAVARACLAGDGWLAQLVTAELPAWPAYQRGGGGAVLRAASAWARRQPPWEGGSTARQQKLRNQYFSAGANGVAMRIAPHAIWSRSHDELIRRVIADGITTHGHPRALVGALTYACALYAALETSDTISFGHLINAAREGLVGPNTVEQCVPHEWLNNQPDLSQAWRSATREMTDLLDVAEASIRNGALSNATETLTRLGCTDPKIYGAGTITSAAAIYLAARFAARPENGLIAAAFLPKADTDTLASMTGALLGATHSTGWLGELDTQVQDGPYLRHVAHAVAARKPSTVPKLGGDVDQLRALLNDHILDGRLGHGLFPDGRTYTILTVEHPRELTNPVRAYLELSDGQHVIVDVHRSSQHTTVERKRSPKNSPTKPNTSEQASSAVQTALTGEGTLRRLTIQTNNLRGCVAFYARLLGRDLSVTDNQCALAPWLLLQQEKETVPSSGLIIEVHVPDVAAAAMRMGHALPAGATVLRVRDPEGRRVAASTH